MIIYEVVTIDHVNNTSSSFYGNRKEAKKIFKQFKTFKEDFRFVKFIKLKLKNNIDKETLIKILNINSIYEFAEELEIRDFSRNENGSVRQSKWRMENDKRM